MRTARLFMDNTQKKIVAIVVVIMMGLLVDLIGCM